MIHNVIYTDNVITLITDNVIPVSSVICRPFYENALIDDENAF